MRRVLMLIAAALFLCPAAAWESDIHYGLTYWLAREAGAKEEVARGLAQANQLADTGVFDAVHLVSRYACLGAADEAASISVSENHFATFGKIPGSPKERAVEAGKEAAWQKVKERLQASSGNLEYEIRMFGLALHRLQDSWAHQGVPDIPAVVGIDVCNDQVAWAHSSKRTKDGKGPGWSSHEADWTHLWYNDTLATAEATYIALMDFVKLHPGIKAKEPTLIAEVMKEIPDFQKAKTKTEKRAWFIKHNIPEPGFLRLVSLDDGTQSFDQPIALKVPVLVVPKPPADVPGEVAQLFDFFFRDWAGTSDFDGMVAKHMDVQTARGVMSLSAGDADNARRQLAQTLRFWRIRDHGRAAAFGHRPFSTLRVGTAVALGAFSDLPLARYETSTQAFTPMLQSGTAQPFAVFRMPSKEGQDRYMAAAKFRHAPNDTVVVVMQKLRNGFRVVSIDSMVEH